MTTTKAPKSLLIRFPIHTGIQWDQDPPAQALPIQTTSVRYVHYELLTAAEARIAEAEGALSRHGYRRSCFIPACNCGDQWTHGGHASDRLREISDALGDLTQGVTLLDAVKSALARIAELEAEKATLIGCIMELSKGASELLS